VEIQPGLALQRPAGGTGEASRKGYLSNGASLTVKADGVQS